MEDCTPKLLELLNEAALQGDVCLLQDLLLRDPFILHRLPSSSTTSPLHMACNLGHKNFVLDFLCRNPSRMEELDPNDKSSLLHVAARNGHLELVTSLVSINPSLCYTRDRHGRTPVHVAAIKGQLHVLEELLGSMPEAARERVGLLNKSGGDTIMHLCARFNQLEALMLAVRMVGDVETMNATNVEGNTILHVAVANKRLEVVEFLLKDRRLEKSIPNSYGLTAMDLFEKNSHNINSVNDQLRSILQREKALPIEGLKRELEKDKHLNWLEKQRSTLMVVASLIATMAFQAGVNPANGLLSQDNYSLQQNTTDIAPMHDRHNSHSSLMAQHKWDYFSGFYICNTIGFVISMSSILLLISGLPCRRFVMALVMVTMWVAVSAMLFSYGYSTTSLLPTAYIDSNYVIIAIVSSSIVIVWICVMGVLFIGHIIRWAMRHIKHLCKCCISNST